MIRRISVLVLLLVSGSGFADVTVSLDRQRVELNESFTLSIDVDTNTDAEPNVASLEEDFFVGQRREMSNTTIVNGQIRRSRSWSYSLMAKRAGTLTIPAIAVGSEQSQPLAITVTEPTYEPPGEADVFITTEIDASETYVQAQVLFRIKVYRAVATRQPALREPSFDGAEVLIEVAGEERNYEAILGGKAYAVNERVYALFPQESGEIEISPARFEARVFRDGRITGRKTFSSEAKTLTVKPIPPLPPEFPTATWLPARDVRITESWSEQSTEIKAGEPITRNVTVSALGQLETQIPAIKPPDTRGISIYPDKPELTRSMVDEGIRGERRDQYAIIGVEDGPVSLPELKLPWFDLGSETWKVARLPATTLTILPSDDLFVREEEAPLASAEPTIVTVQSSFWRRAAEILGAVWLLTIFAWWWSSRPRRDEQPPAEVPLHRQQARALKDARKAAMAGDAATLKTAMLAWGRLQWPDQPPRSVGELATRVSAPLSDELQSLARSTYGNAGSDWDGAALAKALRSFSVVSDAVQRSSGEPLPPLMPQT